MYNTMIQVKRNGMQHLQQQLLAIKYPLTDQQSYGQKRVMLFMNLFELNFKLEPNLI